MTPPRTTDSTAPQFASSEAFFEIVEAAPVAMLVCDQDGVIALANGETRRMLGYEKRELRGRAVAALLSADYLEPLRAFLVRFWQQPESRPIEGGPEFPLRRKDGGEVWVQLGFSPVMIEGKLFALGVMLDVAERKGAERALRESEEKFSKAFRVSPDAISLHEMESGRFVDVNEGFLRLFGYTRAELIGASPADFGIWQDPAEREAFLERMRRDGSVRDFPAQVRRRDGERRLVQLSSERLEIGGQAHNVTVLRDVTEKLAAEQALRESEERMTKAFRASPDAISVSDLSTGRFLDVNEGYERLSGYPRAELIGRTSSELGIWSDPADRLRMLDELDRNGSVRDMQVKALTRNGERNSFLLSAEKVEIAGRPCVVVVSRDITAGLQAEQALRESEEKFSKAFRASPDAIAITDLETGRYIEANGGHEQIFGLTREAVLGRTVLELGYYQNPEDRQRLVAEIRARGSVRNLELACYNVRREPITVLLSGEAIEMNGRPCLVSVIHDITNRKRAEAALRESEEKFAKAFRASPFSLTISEMASGRYIDVNGGFEQLSGLARAEVLGRTSVELNLWHEVADREELVRRLERDGSVRDFEITFRRRDGSLVTTLSNCERIEIGGTPCLLNTIEDITERRKTEQEKLRLEQQLRQSQKLEALGTLAGGIAHDFNNILTAMVVFRELAVMDIDRPDDLRQHLAEIKQATNRAKELVRQILTFSRQQQQERRPLRMHAVVQEALQLLRSSLPATIEMDLAIDEQAPEVLADAGQVHQIVMNLATNAAHAMRDRPGRLTVRLEARQVDEALCRSHPGLRPGLYARLMVADNGHGMTETTLAHIFEPFFTTKAPGEGTGLGLAVVHGIMEDHDGAIAVRSRPGDGTTFELFFPQYAGAAQTAVEPDASIPPGRGERVLLVDDEPPLGTAIADMLRRCGYRVTACTDPLAAVQSFAAAPASFDLVLTDHTMPRLTGLDVIREVHAVRPGIPVILMSGLSSTWTPDKLRGFDIREMVAKPVDFAGLAQAMRRALDAPRTEPR